MLDETNRMSLAATETYGPEYFATHCGGLLYGRQEPHWERFFSGIADHIVRSLRPHRAFDAGCAHGFLLEALWDRGVETWGRDISHFAVSEVRADLRSFVAQGSIADPIEGDYDLITCIEVLEHMAEAEALAAIANMAAAAPRILFSSSPTDLTEPTHINVKPVIWWLNRFAEAGMAPALDYDASYLTSHAYLLERSAERRDTREIGAFAELIRQRMLAHERAMRLGAAEQEVARLTGTLAEAERARQQDAAATAEIMAEVERARQQDAAATTAIMTEMEKTRQREAAAAATAAAALAERGRLESAAAQAEQQLLTTRTAMQAAIAEAEQARQREADATAAAAQAERERLQVAASQAGQQSLPAQTVVEAAIAEAEQARQREAAAAAIAGAALAERARLASAATGAGQHVRAGQTSISPANAQMEQVRQQLVATQAAYDALRYSATWRATRPLRRVGEVLPAPARRAVRRILRGSYWIVTLQIGRRLAERRAARAAVFAPAARLPAITQPVADPKQAPAPQPETEYDRWIRECDTLSDHDRMAIKVHIGQLEHRPLISVVMPAYETPERLLREAIASVRAQLYPYWELCIADDGSPSGTVSRVLRDEAANDPRIKWMRRDSNGHIACATNSALALSSGEFVALMDHDDLLPEHALYEVAAELNAHPETNLIYTDEDQVDSTGRRSQPYFKPDWNIDLMLSHNVFSHLGVYRRSLLERIGGLREGIVDGSQDYDLVLRCAAITDATSIRHIPSVLYHWRRTDTPASFSQVQLDRCVAAARQSIGDYLHDQGMEADVLPAPDATLWNRVRWTLPNPPPRVSVIVPSRDRAELLARCAGGVLHRTDYPNLELLIVDNESRDPGALDLLRRLQEDRRVRVLPFPRPFNYSALNNAAVHEATGEIIVLLNNDIDVIGADWLPEMVSHAIRPDVGAVGAKLLYADGSIQHAGVVLGVGTHAGGPGVAGHFGHFEPGGAIGYFGQFALTRELSAVTGACLAMRREVYETVGGLDAENLPVSFNDVDLCLRIRAHGLRIVWTPFAELYHLESASRGKDRTPAQINRAAQEASFMRDRWGPLLDADPFYNPAFSRLDHTFQLAFPPSRIKPWLRQN